MRLTVQDVVVYTSGKHRVLAFDVCHLYVIGVARMRISVVHHG